MNEGVEIAPDVAARRQSRITDQVTNGVAIRMALLYLLAGGPRWRSEAPGRSRPDSLPSCDLSSVWAVDPATGREGPGEIVVRDGSARDRDLAGGRGGGRRRRERRGRGARFHRPARPPARARQRGRRDDRERARGGGAWRVHHGLRHAKHDPPLDEPGVLARDPRRGCGVRFAGRAAGVRRGDRRAQGRRSPRSASSATQGSSGFSDDGAPVRSPQILRNALAYAGMARAADRRPCRGRHRDRGRGGERRLRGDRPRAARLAGLGRGERRRPRPGDPRGRRAATSPARGCTSRTCRRRGPGSRAAGQGCRAAGHLRRDAASPRAERRMACRGAALGMGGLRAAIRGPTAHSRRRPTTRRCGSTRHSAHPPTRPRCLAALLDGTADAVATDHAPHTEVDKAVEFGLAANGISGIETALGVLLAAVDAGRLTARAGDRGAHRWAGGGPGITLSPRPTGGLDEGAPADLVVFDRADSWTVGAVGAALRAAGTRRSSGERSRAGCC